MNEAIKKLRRILILTMILVIGSAICIFAAPALDGSDVKLQLDGKLIPTDVNPAIVNDRTLVPARAVFEASGGEVIWSLETPSNIDVKYKGKLVKLTIGSKTAVVDGVEKTMDVPAQLFPGDRTLIPVRFVAENLGFGVGWDNVARTVILNSTGETVPITTPNGIAPPIETDPAVNQPAMGKVSKVTFSGAGGKHIVTVSLDKPVTDFAQQQVTNPHRFYIDLKGYTLTATPADFLIDDVKSAVKKVRSSQFEDDTVRIVMDLREASAPTVTMSANKQQIIMEFTPLTFKPSADGRLVVMLDPGHGAETGGKRSFDGSLREYEFNRDVAKRTATILQSQGVETLMTVDGNEDVSLNDRCVKSNNSAADIFVSFHANAFGTNWNKVNGWEVYMHRGGGYAEELANDIAKASIPAIGLVNRGVKTSDFYVVKYTDVPAVLIEHGFYTNTTEVEKLKSNDFRQKCAEADAKGIMNFLNKYK